MGRVLAIDYGLKRTGLAATDSLRIIASPITTIPTHTLPVWLDAYLSKEPVDVIVIGLAKRLDNTDTDTTPHIKGLAKRLTEQYPVIEVVFENEQFTSTMAHQALRVTGANKKLKNDKGLADQVAATIILQSWMDKNPS